MNPNDKDNERRNGLFLACENNPNIGVIKYLIDEQHMSPTEADYRGFTLIDVCKPEYKEYLS